MKKTVFFLRTFFLIVLVLFNNSLYASFENWADDLAESLRQTVLQNAYARRLIFPKTDRIPTVANNGEGQAINFFNIHDSKQLWHGSFRLDNLISAEIVNIPIAPGAFHFASIFHFKNPVKITNKVGESKNIQGLLMGTGPEKDFSVQGIAGMQLIQMRAYSLEFYESVAPVAEKYRHFVDTRKVDLQLLFMTHAEETARLAAMTYLRALQAEKPDIADKPIFQKYNVFGANCVSSGVQNLTRAIKPEFFPEILKIGKKDIKEISPMTVTQYRYWINSWNEVSRQALGAVVGRSPDSAKFRELELFHRQLRHTNMMSLPWRAKAIIDWATIKK